METIATLEIVRLGSDGERVPFKVQIGRPRYDERGSWACPIQLVGLHDKINEIHGKDSMQALCLGIRFVQSMLRSELDCGHRLLQSGDGDDEVDFPLNAYF
jgi:hypothetical protein